MIVFRADASVRIGNGHISRCLTLAAALRERGQPSVFVCRRGPGDASTLIQSLGFQVFQLAPAPIESMGVESLWPDRRQLADAEQTLAAIQEFARGVHWIVSDHYGLGATWQERVRTHADYLLVIDDLANRHHACDMLLDQNHYVGLEGRYQGLVPAGCRLLLGPRNVLLRAEFRDENMQMRERDGSVTRILVGFGSSDEGGETIKALRALQSLDLDDVVIDVVSGASNPRRDEVRVLCADVRRCTYHEQIDYMAKLIREADLALGAGGSAMWERCTLGLPTLTVITAENQSQTTVDTATAGAIALLGRSQSLTVDDVATAIGSAIGDPDRNRAISLSAMSLVPVADGAPRLADTMTHFGRADTMAQRSSLADRL